MEKHIFCVCWRYGEVDQQWRVFGFHKVSFGDHPAIAFLETPIRRAAEIHKDIDPVAAQHIQSDRYVDDLSTGGTPEEV